MSDWDASDDETAKRTTTPAAVVTAKPPVKKWEGEDEEDDGPVVSLRFIPMYRTHQTLTIAFIWVRWDMLE